MCPERVYRLNPPGFRSQGSGLQISPQLVEELRDIENGVLLFLLTCLSPPPGHLTQDVGVKGHKMSRNFVMSQVRGAWSLPTTMDAALSTHHLFTLLQAHPHKRWYCPQTTHTNNPHPQPTPTHPHMSPLWGQWVWVQACDNT